MLWARRFRIHLSNGLIAAGIRLVQELLHLSLILDALLQDEPAPEDGEDPAYDVRSGQHLDNANRQLCFAPGTGVS